MIYKFTIPTNVKKKSPSLNDYIKAERTTVKKQGGRLVTLGALMKKEWQRYIGNCIRRDLHGLHIKEPIVVHYHYYEPDRRRDYGNIHAPVQKFTEDAMQDVGLIPNDNQDYIIGFSADFHVDPKNPRIEVEIETRG